MRESELDQHRYWLHKTLVCAGHSMDPNTQVGAILWDKRYTGWWAGEFNRFPAGLKPTRKRLHDRTTKLQYILHAEMAALIATYRAGRDPRKATLYLACEDRTTGERWGGPPCTRCTAHLIEAGIKRVVTLPRKRNSNWKADLDLARKMLREAGVDYVEIKPRKALDTLVGAPDRT